MSQVEQQQQQQRRREADEGARDSTAERAANSTAAATNRKAAQASADCKSLDRQALIDASGGEVGARAGECARQPTASRLREGGARKQLAGLEFDKTNYQSTSTDELNNNSIAPPGKQQPSPPPQSSQAVAAALPPQQASLAAKQQQPVATPLSLLTGLRMHTSQLRAQQQQAEQQQQQQQQAKMSSERRKPAISGTGQQQQQQRASPHSATNSYVESSLNPPETPPASQRTSASKSPSAYIPSYTSIFQKQQSTGASPSPERSHQQPAPPPPPQQQQQQVGASVTSRSPLIRQAAQQQQQQQQSALSSSGDLYARNLFAAAGRPSESSTATRNRLPSIFDQARNRLKGPGEQQDRRVGHIIDYEDELEEVEVAQNESEDEDEDVDEDELHYRDRSESAASSSGYSNEGARKAVAGSNLLEDNFRGGAKRAANSSPESQKSAARLIQRPVKCADGRLISLASSRRGRSPTARRRSDGAKMSKQQQQQQAGKKSHAPPPQSHSQTRISFNDISRPPSFNTTALQHQQHQLGIDMKAAASCRKLDLLEQAAHLECGCNICSRSRKLAGGGLHDHLHHHHAHSLQQLGGAGSSKLSNFNLNKSSEKNYPKTRFLHMVLKSIILVLCTLLLLLLLVGSILITHYLPQSMDKVVSATRSFNVTIAGRR